MTEKAGIKWRLLAHADGERVEVESRGVFDELVVDQWLHVEQMDDNVWWLRVGDARVNVRVASDGTAEVDVERGFYAEIRGQTRIREP